MKCNICNGKKWLRYKAFKRMIKCPYCDATGTRGYEYTSPLDIQADVYDQWPDGDIFYEDIDDLIDEWHNEDSTLELHEYLGMTIEDYKNFVEEN